MTDDLGGLLLPFGMAGADEEQRKDDAREECEFCGREINEGEGHECWGTRAEAADYARVEDDHR